MKNCIPFLLLSLLCLTGFPSCTNQSPVSQPSTPAPIVVREVKDTDCAKHSFKERGKAPLGFLKGMKQAYQNTSPELRAKLTQSLGSSDKDALTYYGLSPDLKTIYTLAVGLGMRESSGKWYIGRDTSAGAQDPEETETGLFQFSYNSIGADPLLRVLYNQYLSDDDECDLDTFREGVNGAITPPNGKGTKAGDFQQFAKACPRFNVQYALVTLRTLRKHYGPINRKEAEYVKACEELFQ